MVPTALAVIVTDPRLTRTDLPDIVEVSMGHHLLRLELLVLVEHHVKVEARLQVAQPSEGVRLAGLDTHIHIHLKHSLWNSIYVHRHTHMHAHSIE